MSPFMTKAAVGWMSLLTTTRVTPCSMRRQRRRAEAATTMSQPSTRSAPPGRDAHRVQILRRRGDAHMAHHRAVLLRQAGEVEHGAALAFEMRRHAEQRADGDDAGAADAGDEDAVGLARAARGARQRQTAPAGSCPVAAHCGFEPCAARRHAR